MAEVFQQVCREAVYPYRGLEALQEEHAGPPHDQPRTITRRTSGAASGMGSLSRIHTVDPKAQIRSGAGYVGMTIPPNVAVRAHQITGVAQWHHRRPVSPLATTVTAHLQSVVGDAICVQRLEYW
jgi:hypothetical protein